VVTQPDAPGKRGGKLEPSPVKKFAISYGIPVHQFNKIRKEGNDVLKAYNADVMVTCAYGQILSKENLEITPVGTLNIHGSILPKYRGAAPIQWSIINGDKVTGITILKSGVGMDDGDIMYIKEMEILDTDSAETMYPKLSVLGAECILKVLSDVENGVATYTPQNHDESTHCTMISKEMCKVDFTKNASDIVNLIRGVNLNPVAHFKLCDVGFKVYSASKVDNDTITRFGLELDKFNVSEVALATPKSGLIIRANDGFVKLGDIQPEGGKRMDSRSYLNGKKIEIGSKVE
jgi:methionyl-tRNA formyltransferase